MVEASELFCPRCRQRLVRAEVKGVELHGCGACGGIWLSNADSQKVVAALPPEVKQMSQNAQANARAKPDVEQPLQCVVCRYELKRTWPVTGIGLDVCATHGTWFDAGELHEVVQRMRVEKAYGKANQAARRSSAIGYMPSYEPEEDVQFKSGVSMFAADVAEDSEGAGVGMALAVGLLGVLFDD